MAELRSVKSRELRELAKRFREHAAEAAPGTYRDLMLRTMAELEELAQSLEASDGSELVLFDEKDEKKDGGAS
jgi:hypothetical protein